MKSFLASLRGGWKKFTDWTVLHAIYLAVTVAFRPKISYASAEAKKALKSDEPLVVVINHVRGFDCAVMMTLLRRPRLWPVVAQDMFEKVPALNWLFSHAWCIKVDRTKATLSWLKEGRQVLKSGERVILCPEGYCNFERYVRDFKPGFAMLAAQSGVRVLPVYHNGEYHILHGHRYRCLVGDPIRLEPMPAGLTAPVLEREAAETRAVVLQLEEKLNGTVRHAPDETKEDNQNG